MTILLSMGGPASIEAQQPQPVGLQKFVGGIVGKHLLSPLVQRCEWVAQSFLVEIVYLDGEVDFNQPLILGSNHQPPRGTLVNWLARHNQFPVAAFAIPQALEEQTNAARVDRVAMYSYQDRKQAIFRLLEQTLTPLPLRREALAHANFHPANLDQHDDQFLTGVSKALDEGAAVLFFPEFMHNAENSFQWDENKNPKEPDVILGIIALAMRKNVPIVPMFILGDDAWGKRHMQLFIGKPFRINEFELPIDATPKPSNPKERKLWNEERKRQRIQAVQNKFREVQKFALELQKIQLGELPTPAAEIAS